MLRTTTLFVAALSLVAATTADACTCAPYQTQAEADRAGEAIYRSADLIVDATVGDVSARYKAMCPAPGTTPRADDLGRSVTGDRPITVHRVLKGKAPPAPILAGQTATIYAEGCGVTMNSCDVAVKSGSRSILILQRGKDGRFATMSFCALMALSHSKRGRALFGAM